MLIKAEQNYIRMSPQKLRSVVGAVKTIKDPLRAVQHLAFVKRRAALPLIKVFKQALANAKNNKGIKEELLQVKEIVIGEGPRFKRLRAGPRGMARPILKRTSHIRVLLETKEAVNRETKRNNTRKNAKVA